MARTMPIASPMASERSGLAQDEDEDVAPRGAERHAHADLVAAAHDHERDDAVEADHGEQRGEKAEERREAAPSGARAGGRRAGSRSNGANSRSISGLTAPIAAVSDGTSVPSGRSERTTIENQGRGSRSWACGEEDDRREVLAQVVVLGVAREADDLGSAGRCRRPGCRSGRSRPIGSAPARYLRAKVSVTIATGSPDAIVPRPLKSRPASSGVPMVRK